MGDDRLMIPHGRGLVDLSRYASSGPVTTEWATVRELRADVGWNPTSNSEGNSSELGRQFALNIPES